MKRIVIAAALAFVAILSAVPAQAQRARVFVASYGSDSNPCTFGSPCKTFQQAVNVVAVGGEVTAIDSAGFGPISISHSVTITSPNGVEAGIAAPASGGAAITINASSGDVVSLNGLTLDGDNVTNTNGVVFNSGGGLTVRDSVIRNFTNAGIFVDQASAMNLSISNTSVLSNATTGINLAPTADINLTLDHVAVNNNLNGLKITTVAQPNASTNIRGTITNSSVSANGQGGLVLNGDSANTAIELSISDTNISNHLAANAVAISASGLIVNVILSRTTLSTNITAVALANNAHVSSAGNNNFNFNNNLVTGGSLSSNPQQ